MTLVDVMWIWWENENLIKYETDISYHMISYDLFWFQSCWRLLVTCITQGVLENGNRCMSCVFGESVVDVVVGL